MYFIYIYIDESILLVDFSLTTRQSEFLNKTQSLNYQVTLIRANVQGMEFEDYP